MKISIVGLGYVGLPLAIEFSKHFNCVGFDISKTRVEQLKKGIDSTKEFNSSEILNSKLFISSEISELIDSDYFIVTVPTPLNKKNKPDLKPLKKASKMIGKVLKRGDIVIYESTVYPGCTEEECIPVLEKYSNLNFNKDFFVGYSPERINPGDKKRKIKDIIKVVSGSTSEVTLKVNKLYKKIIDAGTHIAPSIKVAEASKIIENVQRDVNISLVNEFALIFEKLGIDTKEVLDAASTKWNFLDFKPGLVGGHCIGVDPYYLAYKALQHGYKPKVLLSGRKVNNSISTKIVTSIQKKASKINLNIKKSDILVLGVTFKENCTDIRNSRVFNLINDLKKINSNIDVYDPYVNHSELKKLYDINLIEKISKKYSVIVVAVAHSQFLNIDFNIIKKKKSIIYDVKSFLPKKIVNLRL